MQLLLPLLTALSTRVFVATVSEIVWAAVGVPVKVPGIVRDVGFGVIVSTFAPSVIVTLPELRTLAVNVPPLDAAVPPLAVKAVPATVTVVPFSLEPVNVPVRLALTAWKPVTFSANTTKSSVQLGA